MRQLLAIARNTCVQTIRQPLYGIIVLVTLGAMTMAPSLTGWTLEDDNKMLRDIGLSTLLIQGLFLACFAASSVLNTEIEEKTVLTVAAKPVSRYIFILGKYVGILAALTAAHYLVGIAFFMTLRHGVLQSAAESSDVSVLILGPGVMVVLAIAAALLNYIYERRFLPTLICLAVPFMSLSAGILLVLDRDWQIQDYELSQTMDDLPPQITDNNILRGIVTFRPLEGQHFVASHRGHLVRSIWKGPISEADQAYLVDLSESLRWKKDVNALATEARELQGVEIFKAGLLIWIALAMLSGIALAASARLGMIATSMSCLILLAAGLAADQVLKPVAEMGQTWAKVLYRLIPNFQCFWMVDALSEYQVIPWDYMGSALSYGSLWVAAFLLLGMALFETREVG